MRPKEKEILTQVVIPADKLVELPECTILVRIAVQCPNCSGELVYEGGFLATDGPRFRYKCKKCGLFASVPRLLDRRRYPHVEA